MLIDYLPTKLKKSNTIKDFELSLNIVNNEFQNIVEDLFKQFFIKHSTWGLELWEKSLAITVDTGKNNDYRHSKIISKIRGSGTTTKQMIQNTCMGFSGGEVKIIEDYSNYRIKIKFVNIVGIPPNMDDLISTIEEIKPAHLAYEFIYLFNTHKVLKNYTHKELAKYTHKQLKEMILNDN